MTDRTVSIALILTSAILDGLILVLILVMPRSGLESLAAVYVLYPLIAIRGILAIVSGVLAIRRKRWSLGLYTLFALALIGWLLFLSATLSPSYEPLHKVLRIEARAMAVRFGDYLDQRAYDASRDRQNRDNPQHGRLCDLLSVERDLSALDDSILNQDLDRPCITYDGQSVSPLLHAVIHTYGPWRGDLRAQPPVEPEFLGPAAGRLLEAGASPNAQDDFGNTALHYALTFQDEALADVLLANDACVLIRNGLDESPLTNHSNYRLRRKIEAAASNPEMLSNCPAEFRGTTAETGPEKDDARTPDAGLLSALRGGRLERAIDYLEQGANPNASDREGSSFEAALRNCRDNAATMAQLLIDAGGDINGRNSKRATALMIAMRYCVETVPFLLSRGADPTLADRGGDTPLHQLGGVAPERLDDTIDQLLAGGADLNQQTRTGQTPLIRSIFAGAARTRIMRALLARGADLNLADNAGNTPLHILASRKRDEGAPALMARLIDQGALLELQNRKHHTPLVTAMERGSPAAMQVLIDAGADVGARRSRGQTMLSGLVSCQAEKIEKLRMLVAAGADTSIPIEHGALPLGQAFFGRSHLDCLEPARLLLNAGADPNQRDPNGAAAIHGIAYWSEKDPADALDLLRQHGAGIDIRNQQGMTALLLAARYGTSIRTLKRLLAQGADPDARDNDGNTLLHAAAMNSKDGTLERYDWVLANGGDPDARNHAGQTPSDRARLTRNVTLLSGLEARQAQ